MSVIALLISFRANVFAHSAHKLNVKNREDADKVLLAEKKGKLLNELDRQHVTLAMLSFVTAQQILLFKDCPQLDGLMPEELSRLRSNLQVIENLEESYEPQRFTAEAYDAAADIPKLDSRLAEVRRLTIHLEKDIAHEKMLLEQLKHLVATAPAPDSHLKQTPEHIA